MVADSENQLQTTVLGGWGACVQVGGAIYARVFETSCRSHLVYQLSEEQAEKETVEGLTNILRIVKGLLTYWNDHNLSRRQPVAARQAQMLLCTIPRCVESEITKPPLKHQKGHLPSKCSQRTPSIRSTEPNIALCSITGRAKPRGSGGGAQGSSALSARGNLSELTI
eukprot:4961695-Amphidinium_carterae.2